MLHFPTSAMASSDPQSSSDEYRPGQLTQLLQSGTVRDATLESLFKPVPEKPVAAKQKRPAKPVAADQVTDGQDSSAPPPKRQKAGSDSAELSERAAVKARSKLAKQREKARLEDPRNPRTVFVGNVASAAKKRDLLLLFRAHGPIESVRFRSAAPADANVVKRLAVIHKKLSRQSLNAYVVYKEAESAVAAAKALNGHSLAGLHLRVDCLAAAASEECQRDDKKCVFLGNLAFKCDEESVRSAFAQCGRVTNVRLVRDSQTGIGRGFGYVQFADAAAVELALKLAGTEVAGRQVRVSRCSDAKSASKPAANKKQRSIGSAKNASSDKHPKAKKSFDRKPQQQQQQQKQQQAAKKRSQARPTNRNFAQAFQRMLDKRRSRQGGRKSAATASGRKT